MLKRGVKPLFRRTFMIRQLLILAKCGGKFTKKDVQKKLITYIGPSNLAAHRHVASRRSFYIPCVDWVRIRRLNADASWKNHSVIFITDKLLGSLTGVPVRWHGGLAFKRPHFSVADWFCFHSDVFRFFGFAEKLSRGRWIGWVHLA